MKYFLFYKKSWKNLEKKKPLEFLWYGEEIVLFFFW